MCKDLNLLGKITFFLVVQIPASQAYLDLSYCLLVAQLQDKDQVFELDCNAFGTSQKIFSLQKL